MDSSQNDLLPPVRTVGPSRAERRRYAHWLRTAEGKRYLQQQQQQQAEFDQVGNACHSEIVR